MLEVGETGTFLFRFSDRLVRGGWSGRFHGSVKMVSNTQSEVSASVLIGSV
jgi:hypothetical protein